MQMFYCNDENRTKNKIVEQVQSLCEGKLREIVSTMTVEAVSYTHLACCSRSALISQSFWDRST